MRADLPTHKQMQGLSECTQTPGALIVLDIFLQNAIILFWEMQLYSIEKWNYTLLRNANELPFVSPGPSASLRPPDLESEEDNVRTVSTIMSLGVTKQKYCHYANKLQRKIKDILSSF